jgi:hypothetical protein
MPFVFRSSLGVAAVLLVACGDDDAEDPGRTRPDEATGSVCTTADECFPDVVDRSMLAGEPLCLDRVRDGYCTHECEADDDCCAATGECRSNLTQVCSPFESTDTKMCFLSCEDEDVRATLDGGVALDEQDFCQREASPDFICRSSGGGSQNRKVCVPGDCGVGAACADDADCDADLRCFTTIRGGYCTKADCTDDASCPTGSVCRAQGGAMICLRSCSKESDCGFCRGRDVVAACNDDVCVIQ